MQAIGEARRDILRSKQYDVYISCKYVFSYLNKIYCKSNALIYEHPWNEIRVQFIDRCVMIMTSIYSEHITSGNGDDFHVSIFCLIGLSYSPR